jgi:hypothetical protein
MASVTFGKKLIRFIPATKLKTCPGISVLVKGRSARHSTAHQSGDHADALPISFVPCG